MQAVHYAATRLGYCVQVVDNGQIVDEFSTGNSRHDSQVVVDAGSPGAVSLRQLRRWAKQTAGEIAEERGIERVQYDPDLEADLNERDFFALGLG